MLRNATQPQSRSLATQPLTAVVVSLPAIDGHRTASQRSATTHDLTRRCRGLLSPQPFDAAVECFLPAIDATAQSHAKRGRLRSGEEARAVPRAAVPTQSKEARHHEQVRLFIP
ncbi:hypothetical protein DEO72_LG3g180 [Vigna unguiculata]|uniref:Uncharacterized protein n=1 Tax=Vigna unguiculata TaxID=3917 RepID=A0A4D6LB35_VIGUN|nr:hypothetical protein DEO72_LG3g180 [Vigna unguiculata]